MDDLKQALIKAPALKPIDYEASGKIVLSVDSSLIGWGAILQQEDDLDAKQRHPSKYENGLWTPAEKKYDGGKLECRGLLKALKKLRYYLYGVRFLVEIDAKTLVHQLNQPATDLPGSVVNRWLAWIRLFDFELKHVSGTKHGGPDSLSRRPTGDNDSESGEDDDVEDAMDADLSALKGEAAEGDENLEREEGGEGFEGEDEHERAEGDDMPEDDAPDANDVDADMTENDMPEEDVLEEFRNIICYLTTFERPEGLTRGKYLQFQRFATKFLLQDSVLFRHTKPNMPPSRAVW